MASCFATLVVLRLWAMVCRTGQTGHGGSLLTGHFPTYRFHYVQTRLKVLKQAGVLLFKYLDTCERLDLFEEADRQAWQSMLKDGGYPATGGRQSESREQKIDRFR